MTLTPTVEMALSEGASAMTSVGWAVTAKWTNPDKSQALIAVQMGIGLQVWMISPVALLKTQTSEPPPGGAKVLVVPWLVAPTGMAGCLSLGRWVAA